MKVSPEAIAGAVQRSKAKSFAEVLGGKPLNPNQFEFPVLKLCASKTQEVSSMQVASVTKSCWEECLSCAVNGALVEDVDCLSPPMLCWNARNACLVHVFL